MIDIKLLRENLEPTKAALKKKRYDVSQLDAIIELDKESRALSVKLEEKLAHRNKFSKEMGSLPKEEREKRMGEMQFVKEEIGELETKKEHLDTELKNLLVMVPNPPHESVPEGGEDDNKPFKTVGSAREFDFEPRDHAELGKMNDWIDMEAAVNMSGSRFYYLKNTAVLLEFALTRFVIDKLMKKGFTPVIPPVLVKEKAMYATGFFPTERSNIYHVNPEDDDLYLVGTSEVPLCMLHADQILPSLDKPIRYVGFSSCFRREAGTYGKDASGIMRVHQFEKLEMFSFCHPDQSEQEHEFIRGIEEEIMTDLGFHYQVINICGGDLGAPAAKKYDIEVWIPTQKKFRELTSASNCTDYQARRANIRFKDTAEGVEGGAKGGKTRFVHTLNGTATAMTRTILAIMENYQQKDGTIEIPEVLKKFM